MSNDLSLSNNLNLSLSTPEIDPQFLVVANAQLEGRSIDEISEMTGLSIDRVASISERSDVKRYVETVFMSQGYLNRVKRMKLINKVIDKKVEEALDTDVWSKKDLLEWIKLLNELDKNLSPKAPSTAVQVNQTNNYTTLLQDLFKE